MNSRPRYQEFGDKAKNCTLARFEAKRLSPRSGPLKGCEEDCWDYEACLRLSKTDSLIISNADKEDQN